MFSSRGERVRGTTKLEGVLLPAQKSETQRELPTYEAQAKHIASRLCPDKSRGNTCLRRLQDGCGHGSEPLSGLKVGRWRGASSCLSAVVSRLRKWHTNRLHRWVDHSIRTPCLLFNFLAYLTGDVMTFVQLPSPRRSLALLPDPPASQPAPQILALPPLRQQPARRHPSNPLSAPRSPSC